MNETQRDPLTRPPTRKPQRPGARIRATASGIERTSGRRRAASRGRARGPATAGWRVSWDGGHCGAHSSRSARCPRRTRGIRPSPLSIDQTFRVGSGVVARGLARPQAFPSPRGRTPSARGQLERGSRRGAAGAAEAPPTGVERSFLPVKKDLISCYFNPQKSELNCDCISHSHHRQEKSRNADRLA